jgi:hypothetical protein
MRHGRQWTHSSVLPDIPVPDRLVASGEEMASNIGKAEQKLVVFLARIAEGELIDPREGASALLKVDEFLVSEFRIRSFSFHMLARTFHPIEWFARIDSVTGIQGNRNRIVGRRHQSPVGDSGALMVLHRSLHEVPSDVETLMPGRDEQVCQIP